MSIDQFPDSNANEMADESHVFPLDYGLTAESMEPRSYQQYDAASRRVPTRMRVMRSPKQPGDEMWPQDDAQPLGDYVDAEGRLWVRMVLGDDGEGNLLTKDIEAGTLRYWQNELAAEKEAAKRTAAADIGESAVEGVSLAVAPDVKGGDKIDVDPLDLCLTPEQHAELRRAMAADGEAANMRSPDGRVLSFEQWQKSQGVGSLEPAVSKEHRALTVGAQIDALTKGLSGDDVRNLKEYADRTRFKRNAQTEGRGDDSIRNGNLAGQAYRRLSPAAQALAAEYLELQS